MSDTYTTNRRLMLQSAVGLGAGMLLRPGEAAAPRELDLSSPAKTLDAYVKLLGSLSEAKVYVVFTGTLWGILPDRVPTAICGFSGLARHQWTPRDDSYHRKSFDVGCFCDLDTGNPIDSLINPFTSERVEPFHYTYGGGDELYTPDGLLSAAEVRSSGVAKPYDLNWQSAGNQVWLTDSSGGEFPAPLPQDAWPRESSGDVFRFAGETTMATTLEQLNDKALSQADYSLFWTSMLSWEPWLLMDGRPGFVMWRGVGAKLRRYDDAPSALLDFVVKVQPNYFDDADPWQGVVSNYERYRQMREPAS